MSKRVRIGGVALLILAIALITWQMGWFRSPPLPPIDLSAAEPEVVEVVRKAMAEVRNDPRNAATWGKLGMVLRANDFDTESVVCLQNAEQLDPLDPRWPYFQGLTQILYDPDRGLDSLARAVKQVKADRPEPVYRYGEALIDAGRLEDAEKVLKTLPGTDPRAAYLLARLAAQRGDAVGVLARMNTIKNHPSARKKALLLRVDAFRLLNQSAEAERELQFLSQLPDDTNWSDRYVADVLEFWAGSRKDRSTAEEFFAVGNLPAGIAVLEKSLVKNPNQTSLRLLLGQALIESGRAAQAVPVLSELVKQDESSVEGWFRLGVARFLTGDATAASEAFLKVVALKPDHALGYFNLGHVRKKLNDRTGAEKAFQEALRCRPDYEAAAQALRDLQAGK